MNISEDNQKIIVRSSIYSRVPNLKQGTDDDNTNTQTLAMICEQYPLEAWTNVYTDFSAIHAIQDDGLVLSFTSLMTAQKQTVQQQ